MDFRMTGYRDEIGQTLCAARQAAGLTLGDVAAKIRIKPVYLAAIEAGHFERLPALPQTLGFTRTYARHLKVNVEEQLARLGEDVHRHIDSTDYSAPELAWAEVPMRRIAWVAAGVVFGVALLALSVVDFGPSPVAPVPERLPPLHAVAPAAAPVRAVAPAAIPATVVLPVRSVYGSSPVSAVMAAALFGRGTAAAAPPATTAPVAAATPVPDLVATMSVYLRAAPANEGRVLGVLAACEPLTLVGEGRYGQWRQVKRADGVTGWVYHGYLGAEAPSVCR